MRLKVKTGINNCSLIDDSYSSDFQSLKIALISWKSKAIPKKDGYSFDIFQSGLSNEELYSKVSQLIISNNISRVIGIEKPFPNSKINLLIALRSTNGPNLSYFDKLSFANETILIKGAWSLVWRNCLLIRRKDTWDGSWNSWMVSAIIWIFKPNWNQVWKMVMVKASVTGMVVWRFQNYWTPQRGLSRCGFCRWRYFIKEWGHPLPPWSWIRRILVLQQYPVPLEPDILFKRTFAFLK
jgi:hypothetical protein